LDVFVLGAAKAARDAIVGMKHALVHVHTSLNKEQNSAIVKCIRMYEKSIPAFEFTAELIKDDPINFAASDVILMAKDMDAKCGNMTSSLKENKAANYIRKYRTLYSTAVTIVVDMIDLLIQNGGYGEGYFEGLEP
jgi:DNA-directed RNA polymerase subunit H (RpoH/RPB5)